MPQEAVWRFPDDRARWLAGLSALVSVFVTLAATAGFVSSFAWPQSDVGDRDAMIEAGVITDFVAGEPVFFQQGRFWLVRQTDGGFVAFSAADSFRGCTVVWRSDLAIVDPRDRVEKVGWYRDPCHGSVYDPHGAKVFGPSPRDLDTYPVEVIGRQVFVRAAGRHLIKAASRPWLEPLSGGRVIHPEPR